MSDDDTGMRDGVSGREKDFSSGGMDPLVDVPCMDSEDSSETEREACWAP